MSIKSLQELLTVRSGLSVQYNVREAEREQISFQSLAEGRQSRS